MRTASRLFAILALSFVAIAALEIYFAVPTAPPPPWTVDNTEFVLGDVPSGKRVVTVHGGLIPLVRLFPFDYPITNSALSGSGL